MTLPPMIPSYPSLERLFADFASFRMRAPVLMLSVALGGCAASDVGRQVTKAPLVAYTAVGSGTPLAATPYASQDESNRSRPRALSPIPERPRYEDETVPARQPMDQKAGQRTTLNFNEADLHGVVR